MTNNAERQRQGKPERGYHKHDVHRDCDGEESAESGHPDNGKRPVPDELAEIVANLIAPIGRQPCKWSQKEFEQALNDYMQRPPCLLATNGGLGFTAEFPFGRESGSSRRRFWPGEASSKEAP
jgi:hypothetical protein